MSLREVTPVAAAREDLDSGNLPVRYRSAKTKACYSVRRPKGWNSYLILLLTLLYFSYQQNATYNLLQLDIVAKQDPWVTGFLNAILFQFFPKLLYPVAGWLSDAKLGRKKVIQTGVFITWVAAVGWLGFSIVRTFVASNSDAVLMVAAAIFYIFTAVGTACFQVNIIPFGIEQMEDCSSEEIGSFIHWYYWTRNVNFGLFIQFAISGLGSYCNADKTTSQEYNLVISFIQILFLTAAFLLFMFSKNLSNDPLVYSPINKIRVITSYICKHSKPVSTRSAFSFTTERLPVRSDFAKKSYGGIFEEEDVEEVATFWRMVIFLLPVGVAYFMVLTTLYSYSSLYQHMAMRNSMSCARKYIISSMLYNITYAVSIPAFEFVIYPFFRKYNPRLIVKIGMGMVFMLVGYIWLTVTDETGHIITHRTNNMSYNICFFYNLSNTSHTDISPYTIIPVIVIVTIGELFTIISSLEFICAQAPSSMRSLLVGLLYFIDGMGALLMSSVMLAFAVGFKYAVNHLHFSCGSSYTLVVFIIGANGFIAYIAVARWYRNRQRGGQSDINYQYVVEEYFEQHIQRRDSATARHLNSN